MKSRSSHYTQLIKHLLKPSNRSRSHFEEHQYLKTNITPVLCKHYKPNQTTFASLPEVMLLPTTQCMHTHLTNLMVNNHRKCTRQHPTLTLVHSKSGVDFNRRRAKSNLSRQQLKISSNPVSITAHNLSLPTRFLMEG